MASSSPPAAHQRSTRYPELFKKAGSSRWWARIPNPAGGRALREPTGHVDELAAHRWYLARVRTADHATPKKDRTLLDALGARIEWLKAARASGDPTRRKLSQATIEFYEKKSRHLWRVLGAETMLSTIGHEDLRRYVATRTIEGAKGTTIARELTTLSMALKLARKDGVECAAYSDIAPEGFAADYVPKRRWLPEDQVDALVFSGVLLPKRAAVVAIIVATSATYPSEVAPIRPGDIVGFAVHLRGTKRKGRNRVVHVPSHARKYLRFARKHLGPDGFEPWSNIRGELHRAAELLSMCRKCRAASLAWGRRAVGAKRFVKGDCAACRVADHFEALSPNDLRRTFAQWLSRSGVPHEITAPLMGHASTRMLETVYGKREGSALGALVEAALRKAPKGARRAG